MMIVVVFVAEHLWTAPEFDDSGGKSPAGDVYSYGIILQEILLKGLPFCLNEFMEAKGGGTNPLTPKSDQCQNSPAASPEIHITQYGELGFA